jgi:hypothetical protein
VGSANPVPDALAVGDFNRDGALDLAVCDKVSAPGWVRILRGDGSGGFSPATPVAVGDQPTAIVAADFNRDGYLDLAVANEGTDDVQVLLNGGDTFSPMPTPLTLPGTDVNPLAIAADDFDGDGDADLAVAAFGGDRLHLYRNDNGTFTSTPVVSLDAPYILRSMTAADVNLDGRPDLLAVATGLTVFRGRGGLDFEAPETVMAGWLPQAAVVGELSGDGWPDLAVVNEDSRDVSLLISTPCQGRRLEVALHPAACEVGLPPYAPTAEVRPTTRAATSRRARRERSSRQSSRAPATLAVLAAWGRAAPGERSAPFTGRRSIGRADATSFSSCCSPTSHAPSPRAALRIHSSMCPGGSSTFSTEASYDEYAWTLTPDVVPPASTYTPTVTLRNPPVTGPHTLGVSARVDGCFLQASQQVFGGPLQSTSLQIDGYSTVCVDCIGGTIKPVDVGGGPAQSRQWGYRTLSGTGGITDMPGETAETYVLKGASFPGPGLYSVVVRTTPTCGTATVS